MIQNTNAIVAQDASDSSGLAVLETNVILKPAVARGPADLVREVTRWSW